ncbi:MAG: hypothetical protein WCT11_04445 [Candidatus Magasanikbacteria bacterium]
MAKNNQPQGDRDMDDIAFFLFQAAERKKVKKEGEEFRLQEEERELARRREMDAYLAQAHMKSAKEGIGYDNDPFGPFRVGGRKKT